jgi:hypothetical protein
MNLIDSLWEEVKNLEKNLEENLEENSKTQLRLDIMEKYKLINKEFSRLKIDRVLLDKINKINKLTAIDKNERVYSQLNKEFNVNNTALHIINAYSDCNNIQKNVTGYRCTNFISEPITMSQAYKYLRAAIPGGYNDFDAELLLLLPQDWQVMVAREGSVCLYVLGDHTEEIKNFDIKNDETMLCDSKFYKHRLFWMNQDISEIKEQIFILSRPPIQQERTIMENLIQANTITTRIWWD